ncbi:MAG: hypothetical protein JST80_03825 [Bdellovibrionales bacterium]|nr:hypothetical protein [Bdellovibrionales bacterium]
MANKLFISAVILLSFSTLGVPNAEANKVCEIINNISRFIFPKYDADKMLAAAKSANDEYLVDYAFGRELVLISLENNTADAGRLDRMIDDKVAELETAIQNGGGLQFRDYKSEIEKLEQMRQDTPVSTSLYTPQTKFSADDISKMELTPRTKVAALITIVENAFGQALTPPTTLKKYLDYVVDKAKVKDGVLNEKENGRILKLIVKRINPMELPETQEGALMTTNMRTRLERMLTKTFKPRYRQILERSALRDPFFRSYVDSVLGIGYRAPKNGVAKRTARNLFFVSLSAGINIGLVKLGMPPLSMPWLALQANVSDQVKNTLQTKGFEEATNAMTQEINFLSTTQLLLRPIRMLRTRALIIFAAAYLGQHPQLITMPYDMFKVYQTTRSEAPADDPSNTVIYGDGTASGPTTANSASDYDAEGAIQNAVDDFTINTDIASDIEIAAMRTLYERVDNAAKIGAKDSLPAIQASRLEIIKKYRLVNWAIGQRLLSSTPSDADIQKLMNSADQNVVAKRTEIGDKAANGEYDSLYISAVKLTAIYNEFASHYKK